MEEKQQIEEIAQDICGHCVGGVCELDGKKCDLKCTNREIAEKTYNASYRKQSEGEWLLSPDGVHPILCNKCGAPAPFVLEKDEFGEGFYRHPFNYCPNCGAKMRKEGEGGK